MKSKEGAQLEDMYARLVKIHGKQKVINHLDKIIDECKNNPKDAARYTEIKNAL